MTFTVDDLRAGIGRAVDRLARSSESRMHALATIARRCGMTPRSLRRTISGESKINGLQTALNIRAAYRKQLADKIAEYQAELKAEEEKDKFFDVWDYDLQIEELERQVAQRREDLINGNYRPQQ